MPVEYATSLNVVYFPQLGYFHLITMSSFSPLTDVPWDYIGFLICVPMKEEWTTERGIDVYEGWTFQVRVHIDLLYVSASHESIVLFGVWISLLVVLWTWLTFTL